MFDLSGITALVVEAGSGIGETSSQGFASSGASSYVTGSYMMIDGG
jgi:NAD(P)-dependent dehydrogenase (short-subunit alcohol dehydrogenase family)